MPVQLSVSPTRLEVPLSCPARGMRQQDSGLLRNSPRRPVSPTLQRLLCPCGRLIFVTRRARVWNLILIGHPRRNEFKRVAPDEVVRQCLLDFRHMACETVASGAAGLVVSMRLDGCAAWAIGRIRSMAFQAHLTTRFDQVGVVLCPVHVMA
jgi:hypothetical protein